jgi:poly-gamma-glutamate synthesis protein (capsule biosynthesis protein)
LIDAKVDLVIAHHPHVVQEIEQYKNKLIFYSLGNFIFDQYFSKDVEESLAVRMTLSNDDAQFELIPIKGNHSQPIPMNEAEKQVFLKTLSARSTPALKAAIESGKIIISR